MAHQPKSFSLDNTVAIVTGGEGKLGGEFAKSLHLFGATVVSLDIQKSSRSSYCKAHYQVDITDEEAIRATLESIRQNIGTPSILVNCAAMDSPPSAPIEDNGPFETYSVGSWDSVMSVNVKGIFLTCKIFGEAMAKQNYGSIINISSIYGVVAPDQSLYQYRREKGENFFKPPAYPASKAAVIHLTKYLGAYWAKKGVRVNALTLAGVFDNQAPEFVEAYASRIPIGRMAVPEDYAGALIFLASPASSYMTGSNLIVDGGWTAI